jgi:hypothetical protein
MISLSLTPGCVSGSSKPTFPSRRLLAIGFGLAPLLTGCTSPPTGGAPLTFVVQLTESAAQEMATLGLDVPVTGRAYVVLTRDGESEPREQVGIDGVPFWGEEVREMAGGEEVAITPGSEQVIGYPLHDLSTVPPGEYFAQAFLNVYTTFNRADGHTLQMHLNSGAGQSPWRAPGNAYGEPLAVRVDPKAGGSIHLAINQVIPPVEPVPEGGSLQQGNPQDQGELVRFVKIRSEALSEFWGRDMYIGANVLLPTDYWVSADRHYPVLYLTGHFPGRSAPFGYTEDEEAEGGRNAGFSDFWRSPGSPKLILVTVRDANPFYDTGHSVNSANVGPYGDAFTRELIPYLEEEFRILPEEGARILAGGSTGGWEALAIQIFNPDFFGGAWGWCPDPVDFHYYQIVNVYEDENAYETGGDWVKVERPNARRPDGTVVSTIRQEMYYERAVGPDGRSGGQWAIWEALFSPVGENGYAAPIWDRVTGEIDREVAEYWREHWDLTNHLVREWPTLGPSLTGKLHVAVGDMDSYYLNNAVELMQTALAPLEDPAPLATFEYGRKKPHCWIGSSPWRPGEDLTSAEFVQVVDGYLKEKGIAW